ncbi:hypothetical protein CALVIDRAFT_369202 [Calocera viscosa TUFC12733]|uniref:Uncharacterized protein n=1 Tax=Calocera viscosa (strain TUFC12733) TaxID=1330018 RepID=A0A167H020_CALVF|nr:hypothetical protein CALVIDRAFT_369202 [Calocera viscosa TUFC12733]
MPCQARCRDVSNSRRMSCLLRFDVRMCPAQLPIAIATAAQVHRTCVRPQLTLPGFVFFTLSSLACVNEPQRGCFRTNSHGGRLQRMFGSGDLVTTMIRDPSIAFEIR